MGGASQEPLKTKYCWLLAGFFPAELDPASVPTERLREGAA